MLGESLAEALRVPNDTVGRTDVLKIQFRTRWT